MKFKFKFNYFYNCWKVFNFFLFGLIVYELICLSKEVIREASIGKFKDAELEISICYWSNLNDETCYHNKDHLFANPNSTKYPKFDFSCKFEEPVACYTRNFKNLSPKKIIENFAKCELSNLATVENKNENEVNSVNKIKPTYELYNVYICVNYKFEITNNNQPNFKFKLTNNQMNQPFNLFLTFSNRLENEIYTTKKTQIFRRSCWEEEKDMIDCTEKNKSINFDLILFASKNLEGGYLTNCVYRKNSSQNDCYENCIKNEKKYHLLTYKDTDNFTLDFGNSSNLKKLISKCENECLKEDCLNMGYLQKDAFSADLKNLEKGSININLINLNYLLKAVPLYRKSEIIWLFLALLFTLFNINSNKILKKIRIYNFKTHRGKNKKNNKRNFLISTAIAIVVLCLSLIMENFFFYFGKKNSPIFSQEDSITERNVSISICFNLCEIIKSKFNDNYTNCNDELLLKKSINELNQITWDVQDFKINAEVRNTARQYPIRQKNFVVPYFFRDFKKCFFLFYQSNNYWPPLSIQRTSKIHINITNANYSFFIEDGHNLPKINSLPTTKSRLHRLDIVERRLRDGCTNYYEDDLIKSKDDYIQDCLIEKSIQQDNRIPIKVNFQIDKYSPEYLKLKFLNYSNFDNYSKECTDQFSNSDFESECISISTSLAHKGIDNGIDSITVTLTPTIYKLKLLDDENGLVVLNRILSFQIIITGFSIKEFLNLLISIYFISFRSIQNYQLFKRIFNLILFLIYFIQFLFLFHNIINHQMIEQIFPEPINSIIIPKIRICYQIKENLDFNNSLTLKYLEETAIKLEDALKEIIIYDNDNNIGEKLTLQNFKYHNDRGRWIGENTSDYIGIFYYRNLKCFNIQIETRLKDGNIGIQYQKLHKLVLFNFNKSKEDKVFIFLNSHNQLDFLWELELDSMYYNFNYSPFESNYQDDYFYFKNVLRNLKKLFGLSKVLNDQASYLYYLKDSYSAEQYAKTTMSPLEIHDEEIDKPIKNRQFNFYIQFRSIATDKNDNYDFIVNSNNTNFIYSYYIEKSFENSNNLKILVNSAVIKFRKNLRNKYRIVELFIHLLILTSFYFKFDFISLPVFVKQSYPFIKFYFIYFLYYIVSFIVLLFQIWFKLVKFMKFKND